MIQVLVGGLANVFPRFKPRQHDQSNIAGMKGSAKKVSRSFMADMEIRASCQSVHTAHALHVCIEQHLFSCSVKSP